MEELFHYKYLSIKVEELDIQLKDAMAKFKIDFKDYIVNNDEKPNQNTKMHKIKRKHIRPLQKMRQ